MKIEYDYLLSVRFCPKKDEVVYSRQLSQNVVVVDVVSNDINHEGCSDYDCNDYYVAVLEVEPCQV